MADLRNMDGFDEMLTQFASKLQPEDFALLLAGLDPEQRLAGLDPEQVVEHYDLEQLKRLRAALDQRLNGA